MNTILFLVIGLTAGIIITWIIRKLLFEKDHVSRSQFVTLESQLAAAFLEKGKIEERYGLSIKNEAAQEKKLEQLGHELTETNRLLIQTQSANTNLQDRLDTQKGGLEQIGEKFEKEFQLLARKILDEKTEKFNQVQETSLKNLLDPLKINIKEFKEEFQNKLNNEAKEKGSLSQQIKQMMELNQNLSAQADNLTKALSNNVKQQGDWGEEILESILQYTGLQRDIHYHVQKSSKNDDGDTIRPDVIVQYPDGRSLIIDSKVSLTHYTRYHAVETVDEQAIHLAQLLNSFKQHINNLGGKNCQSVSGALDLIMMFVPNESAYITAMQADTGLWRYAYSKRIVLISPTNLIPAMKLVADMWQRDAINRNALDIAEKAGKLYDKLAGFIDNFEKIGGQIEKTQQTWHEAQKQLWKGKGNLLSQAEQMKKMQLKTTKQLPTALTEQALLNDGIDNISENGTE